MPRSQGMKTVRTVSEEGREVRVCSETAKHYLGVSACVGYLVRCSVIVKQNVSIAEQNHLLMFNAELTMIVHILKKKYLNSNIILLSVI